MARGAGTVKLFIGTDVELYPCVDIETEEEYREGTYWPEEELLTEVPDSIAEPWLAVRDAWVRVQAEVRKYMEGSKDD
jgi:hypothetical protein